MPDNQNDKKPKNFNPRELIDAFKIYRFILPYKWHFLIGMIALVISTGVVSVIPGGFGKLVDAASPAKETLANVTEVINGKLDAETKVAKITTFIHSYTTGINPERLKDIGILLGAVLLIQALLSFIRIYLF